MDVKEIIKLSEECSNEIRRAVLTFVEANAEIHDDVLNVCIVSALSGAFICACESSGMKHSEMLAGITHCIFLSELESDS
jgi:hypothetical protein